MGMGLFKKNQKGFSLVEVMIAAGIMGVMAVFFYKFFADSMKQQKTVMMKMEEGNLINEIRILLMNMDNCSETLEGQRLNLDVTGKDNLDEPIDFLKKVYSLTPETEDDEEEKKVEKDVVEKYHKWIKDEQEVVHSQQRIRISDYSLKFTKDDVKRMKKYKRADIFFSITFDRNDKAFGTKIMKYDIPLEVEVGSNNKLISCSSLGLPSGGKAGLLVLDTKTIPSLKDRTGNDACKSKNLSCAYVQSTNYVLSSDGLDSPLYTPACLSSYNQKLQGVKTGLGISNFHSCDAKLGTFKTFEIRMSSAAVITCAGTFSAICN